MMNYFRIGVLVTLCVFFIAGTSSSAEQAFSFYGIGADSTKAQALEEIDKKGFVCMEAKSFTFGLAEVDLKKVLSANATLLSDYRTVDREIFLETARSEDKGEQLKHLDDITVNSFLCRGESNFFEAVTLFYSAYSETLLSMGLALKEYEPVRRQLEKKYGPGKHQDYWENGKDVLSIFSENDEKVLRIFYGDNIRAHRTKVEPHLERIRADKEKELEGTF